jgi:hypothetical protein
MKSSGIGHKRKFEGFSTDSLELQGYLKEKQWKKGSWDDWASQIWAEDLKPQITTLLADCSEAFTSAGYTTLNNIELGRVNPMANVAKFFWGAVVREHLSRHSDIQLFVAVRWGFVRVGLYLNQEDEELFNNLMVHLEGKDDVISQALDNALDAGVELCQSMPSTFSGSLVQYHKSEETWRKEFEKRREIDLVKCWKISDPVLGSSSFVDDVLEAFDAIMPFYDILLGT